mmetsp:Transcript_20342/g.19321  ORF Transcript_20342/g.19321 Transcript_20342/m.19321 type:complete len:81 (+) Transcript_20342:923-1165(+)|eukprot:CAMPEP_0170544360 /NCGR_PEP_ID=MMETSP0211-20121228/3151_1 /TAXON_ID=311385 /ORGANISM="Pseudokeronopsis sp., Strain OXSARD2" /LENGTH=80 /DNA_ID=CAMNT_0010847991 /DNA_START=928 /DNA_END=1170 /DNA_ORIENTATION=-
MSDAVKFENYEKLEDYYEDSSYHETVKDIQVPFFFMNAQDDILTGPKAVPTEKVNENVIMAVTTHGGHCSYLSGGLLTPK